MQLFLHRKSSPDDFDLDQELVIIGSGPAGLTAAIYASRGQLNPLIIAGMEAGGQLMTTTEVENFPGFPDVVQGPDLISRMREQATRLGAKFLEDNVEADLPEVLAKYNSKGYRDARIVSDTFYFVSPNRVNVDVYIDEGNKYYFGKFNWYGNTKYRSGQLDTILNR